MQALRLTAAAMAAAMVAACSSPASGPQTIVTGASSTTVSVSRTLSSPGVEEESPRLDGLQLSLRGLAAAPGRPVVGDAERRPLATASAAHAALERMFPAVPEEARRPTPPRRAASSVPEERPVGHDHVPTAEELSRTFQ